jgi:outer membrane protein insertion porin family
MRVNCFAALLILSSANAWAILPTIPNNVVVRAVRFESSVKVDERDFRHELPLQVGEVARQDDLEASVEWLREKEIFDEIEVELSSVQGGIEVLFQLTPRDFVVAVQVDGARSIEEADIIRKARIREDELVNEVQFRAAEKRIAEIYSKRGYPGTQVVIRARPESPGQVRVVIRVEESAPQTVRSVTIRGLSALEHEEAVAALPFTEGVLLGADIEEEGRTALQRFFRKQSYFEVEVDSELGAQGALTFVVNRGPRFELLVEGNREFSTEQMLSLTDLEDRPFVTDGTWRVLARRMKEFYGNEGFIFADASVVMEGNDPRKIRFIIHEGVRVQVSELQVLGADILGAEEVAEVVRSKPETSRLFFGAKKWFRENELLRDLDRIEALYEDSGFESAHIVDVRRDFTEDQTEVTVTLEIEEGPRSIVRKVQFDPVSSIPLKELESVVESRSGAIFSPAVLEQDQRSLERRLGSEGFVDASVRADVIQEPSREGVMATDIHFEISPGERVRIGQIRIQQNYFTLDRVIRWVFRDELGIEVGDPLDLVRLREAQKDIYRLGLFRSVSVQVEPGSGPTRDVLVRVVERPSGKFEYGFGYNTRAGMRNFVQIEHRNLDGVGRQARLRGELNLNSKDFVPDEYLVTFAGREPHIINLGFDLRANLIAQRSTREIDEFSIERFSVAAGPEREFLTGLRLGALLEIDRSRVFDVAPDAILTGLDEGTLRTVSVNPFLIYDGRDKEFAATRGVFDTLVIRYATPALGSEVHFLKTSAQHIHQFPLWKGLTLLYKARTGIAEPLGSTSGIPIQERFFLGGRTTVRGFDENEIGPTGENGNPIGGDLVFNGTAELRVPLYGAIRGAVFFDAGALYLRDQGISSSGIRESAGPGLRYQTPIGSISLDYGIKLDRRSGESFGEFHFSIGAVF